MPKRWTAARMRRTALKRTGIKRSGRLRARSKTNSHRHVSVSRRRDFMEDRRNSPCEIIHLFPESSRLGYVDIPMRGRVETVSIWETATDPHHVAGGLRGNGKRDYDWSLAALCHPSHRFCETQWGGYDIDGFVLCRYAMVASGRWSELEMSGYLGTPHTLIYCEGRIHFDWVRKYWQEMVDSELGSGHEQ